MTTIRDSDGPQGHQERGAFPAGQDQVENSDHFDNLEDADTLADLNGPETPEAGGLDSQRVDNARDDQPDGDQQLTTDSDALDTGLNDSDLGTDVAGLPADCADTAEREGYAGLGPDAPRTGGDRTGDRATGLTGVRE